MAAAGAEQRRQSGRQEVAPTHPAQPLEVEIGQNRMRQLQGVAMLRRFLEDVALASDIARERT